MDIGNIVKPISLYIALPISEIQYKIGDRKMCHEQYRMHGMHHMHCDCGRHFLTKEEKIERLEEYKKWLDNESKGVQEVIDKLKKTS